MRTPQKLSKAQAARPAVDQDVIDQQEKESRGEDEKDEKEEGEEEEEDEEKSYAAKKGEDLAEDDLEKSLARLREYRDDEDAPTRKQTLLSKAQQEELTKAEQAELFDLLGSGSQAETFANEVSKAMEPAEELQKALDVSEYLRETHDEQVRVGTMLAERIEKSDARQHEFNLLLAKATADIGTLIKAVSERLGVIESQPARRPKSQTRPMEKSFAGRPAQGDSLSKAEILNTLSEIIEKSCEAGQNGVVDGMDLIMASTKYEQFNQINPRVLDMVRARRQA